jgi:hypothetical protein
MDDRATRRALACLAVAVATAGRAVGPAGAQDLGQEHLSPPPALMSEEVARQKLATYGVEDLAGLARRGGAYVARGRFRDRPVEVELDAGTGEVREVRGPGLQGPEALAPVVPMVEDEQIKVDRGDLVRPALRPPP